MTNIDKVAPDAPTVSADITEPTNQCVTVSAVFSDDSTQKQYSTDSNSWQAYTSGVVVTDNGILYFRGIDAVGNISEITSYEVSNIQTKPIANADITSPTNGDVIVTANFSSNSLQKQYSLDNSTWSEYTNGVVMVTNGTVYFRGIDVAGNISEITSYDVTNIDKIIPTKPIASADIITPINGNVTVSAIFSDDSTQRQYSLDNVTWQTYTTGIVFEQNGTVYFRGIDAVGNISEITRYVVGNIDKGISGLVVTYKEEILVSSASFVNSKNIGRDLNEDSLRIFSGGMADSTTIASGGC